MAVETTKRIITIDEYYRMAETGVLSERDRVELIEGEIVSMSPIGSRHSGCVNRLNAILTQTLGQAAVVSVQNPVRLNIYSEPEPDIALLRPRADFYATAHPGPVDVMLIIEVADTSVGYDRQTKVPLYARSGIPEVWLVDLETETVTQYIQPIRGEYQQQKQLKRGEKVNASAISDLELTPDEILGPSPNAGAQGR